MQEPNVQMTRLPGGESPPEDDKGMPGGMSPPEDDQAIDTARSTKDKESEVPGSLQFIGKKKPEWSDNEMGDNFKINHFTE